MCHARISCPSVQSVWSISGLPFMLDMDENLDFISWFSLAITQWNEKQAGLFVLTTFKIWARRNKTIFEPRSNILTDRGILDCCTLLVGDLWPETVIAENVNTSTFVLKWCCLK